VSHNIGDNVAEKRKPAVGSGISCVGIGVGSASQGNLLAKRQLIPGPAWNTDSFASQCHNAGSGIQL